MKPGNKIERQVWKLHQQLPDLTIKQYEWARAAFGQTAYFNKRKMQLIGTYRCTECGHEWKGQGNTEVVCPNCGATLKVEACRKRRLRKCGYFVIINEIAGWMVFRWFWFDHHCMTIGKIWCAADEVMQIWQRIADGREVTIARNKAMFSYYAKNIFSMGSEMSIKRPSSNRYYYSYDIRDLGYEDTYIDELPSRMCYVDWMPYKAKDVDTVFFMRNYLRHPMVETLMKSGKRTLLANMLKRDCFNNQNQYRDAYVNAVRLALKYKYFDEKKDSLLWLDLITQLVDLNLDWHNPTVVLPQNLEEKHTEYSMRIQKIKAEIKRKEDLERNMKMEAQYEEGRKQFFDFEIVDGDINIQVLKSVNDFFIEGGEMKHCVYSNGYYNMTTHPNSLILSARQGNWDKPIKFLETIEIDLKNFKIIQIRGHCNKDSEFHKKIVELMKANLNKIKKICKQRKNKAA